MTRNEQTAALDKAIERATRTGVHVAGLGRFKANPHHRFAIVTSASRPGTYHVVSISDVRLSCDCLAAQHGTPCCVHVAATSMYLTARAARIRRFEEAVEEALREEQAAEVTTNTQAAEHAHRAVEAAPAGVPAAIHALRELAGVTAMEAWRAKQAAWAQEAREREAAPLLRSNAPISPFATVAPRPQRPPLRPIPTLSGGGATPRAREEW